MNPADLAMLGAHAHTDPQPTRTKDPAAAAGEVFARILVREVQRSLPDGGLLGSSDFAPLEALVTDALAQSLGANALGLDHAFGHLTPTSAHTAPLPVGIVDGGRVSSHFGLRHHPIFGDERHHDGIDIAAVEGTPIRAARQGVVREARWDAHYGNLVVVDHGRGLETRYAHCHTLDVHVGERVAAGQQIASVGSTGQSTGPHLHFEVRAKGEPIDPSDWIGYRSSGSSVRSQVLPRRHDGWDENPGS